MMKLPGSDRNDTVTCPRCNTPAIPGAVFCDSCGARIASPPACSLCGTLLEPGSRFCPSCGTMVGNLKDNLPEKEPDEKDPIVLKKPRVHHAEKPKKDSREEQEKAPDPLMMIPEPDESEIKEETGILVQGSRSIKGSIPHSSVITIPPPGKSKIFLSGLGRRKSAVIAGILIGLAILAFALSGLLFFDRDLFAGDTAPSALVIETIAPAVTDTASLPAITTTPIPVRAAEPGSIVPGPTQKLPDNFMVYFQAERDPRNEIVSVQYMGGKGQMGVRDVLVRLTRSDGLVLSESFKPVQVGSGVELQGTEKVDRVEVIVHLHTGEEYKVIDRIFEYKIRN